MSQAVWAVTSTFSRSPFTRSQCTYNVSIKATFSSSERPQGNVTNVPVMFLVSRDVNTEIYTFTSKHYFTGTKNEPRSEMASRPYSPRAFHKKETQTLLGDSITLPFSFPPTLRPRVVGRGAGGPCRDADPCWLALIWSGYQCTATGKATGGAPLTRG